MNKYLFLVGKNMLIVIIPILINKDVFESSYYDLKFTVQNCNYFWTNLTEGEKVEVVTDLIFLGYKITADGDCSHKIKRCLLLGRKAMMNLDSILNSRNIALPTDVCIVKVIGFSSSHVWMWELDHKEG